MLMVFKDRLGLGNPRRQNPMMMMQYICVEDDPTEQKEADSRKLSVPRPTGCPRRTDLNL